MAACALGLYSWVKARRAKSSFGFEKMKMSRLTDLGTRALGMSGDGKYAAFISNGTVWIKEFGSGNQTQLFALNNRTIWGSLFSPDNQQLYVILQEKNELISALFKIPTQGGVLEKITDDIGTPIHFSPDGSRFLFKRGNQETGRNMLISAAADGGDEKIILPPSPRYIVYDYDWAPDAKTLAVVLWNLAEDYSRSWQVVEIPATGGEMKPLTPEQKPHIGRAFWLKDKSGLIMVARDGGTGPRQLWHLSYPGGEVQRITNDLYDYVGAEVTSNGEAIFTTQTNASNSLFVGETANPGNLSRINIDSSVGRDVSWTPDNKLIYSLSEGNKKYIWKMAADGSQRQQLTFDDVNSGESKMSPDGRYITYLSNRSGRYQVWRMDSNGQNSLQLTHVVNDAARPVFSADGQWVFYQAWIPAGWTVWKVPVEGGTPLQLTHRDTKSWVISPDGKQLSYRAFDEARKRDVIAIKSTEGGEPVKTLDFPAMEAYDLIYWRKEGLYCLNQAHTEIFLLSPTGEKPKALTNFKTGDNITFALSPDGKNIAIVRASVSFDPVLITNFQ
jgi:Tol biopolymer transport system component